MVVKWSETKNLWEMIDSKEVPMSEISGDGGTSRLVGASWNYG